MSSPFMYSALANSPTTDTTISQAVANAPTTPLYLKSGQYSGGGVLPPNMSVVAESGAVSDFSTVIKQSGTTILSGGSYTLPVYMGNGDGSAIYTRLFDTHVTGALYLGSNTGTVDADRVTVIGGSFSSTSSVFGGGKIPAGNVTIILTGGTIGSGIFGGPLLNEDISTHVDSANLTITGPTVIGAYIIGGARTNAGIFTINKVRVVIDAEPIVRANTSYAMSFLGGYVAGGTSTVSEVTADIYSSIDGDIYVGSHARNTCTSIVNSSVVNYRGGTTTRLFGGGWAQNSGTSHVENVEMNISGGLIFATYAGGANSAGVPSSIGSAVINMRGGSSTNVYLCGRHKEGYATGDITFNYYGGVITYLHGITPGGIDKTAGITCTNVYAPFRLYEIEQLELLRIFNPNSVTTTAAINSSSIQSLELVIQDPSSFTGRWKALTSGSSINLSGITVSIVDNSGTALTDFGYELVNNSIEVFKQQ